MSAAAFLSRLRNMGFKIRADGLQLFVSPAGRLSEAQREQIQAQRDDLIAACLDPDPRVTCATCVNAHGEWCAAHPRSGLARGYIGGLVTLPQHCPSWQGATQ